MRFIIFLSYKFSYTALIPSLASFPGHRRNGLATSMSSNCYFLCLKVGSTSQISECSQMTIASYIELSQSRPFHFNFDRSTALVWALCTTKFVRMTTVLP